MCRCTIIALVFLFFSCKDHQPADLVVIGKIWTGDSTNSIAEGVAIIKDSIVAVGTEGQIRKWIGDDTNVIRTQPENLVTPGFIDAHTHFITGGFALSSVQLRDAKSREEFIERIREFAQSVPKGTWITAGDWDHEHWGGELPTRDWIDSVTTENPVWINRLDGHMCLANTLAMDAAGITNKVENIKGGTIVRDKKGRPTGVFKDNAMDLVEKVVPPATSEQEDKALEAAMQYVAERGVTSVHNMSGYHEVFERARKNGGLRTRIYAGMMLRNWRQLRDKISSQGLGDKWLRFGVLKEFVDGSLGSHTAAFFEPFSDSPDDFGFFVIDEETLYNRIRSADSAGLQVMVHAIGDKAIHVLLDLFDSVARENGPRDRRFRIEHAQHIHPNDIPRFQKQNIIASMQPYHAIDDGRWADKVIGKERSKTTYAFRSLMNAKAIVAFGSDWFVAPPTPLEGIYAAVTRRTLDDENPTGWVPEQKITVEEALRAYTINAAYASFEENIKGSIEKGKLADIVILERDITSMPADQINRVRVLKTIVGGKIIFQQLL